MSFNHIFVGGNDERETWVWTSERTSPHSSWGRITSWNSWCTLVAGTWHTWRFAQTGGMFMWIQLILVVIHNFIVVCSNCLKFHLSGWISGFLQEAAATGTSTVERHSSRGGLSHVRFCFTLPKQPWYEEGEDQGVNRPRGWEGFWSLC